MNKAWELQTIKYVHITWYNISMTKSNLYKGIMQQTTLLNKFILSRLFYTLKEDMAPAEIT